MTLRPFILGAALAAALPAAAAEVTDYTLENGLQVVVVEDHRAPAVVHMVWYKVGSADEEPGTTGIAHYLEHLMFKGTDTVGPGEFSDIVARNGGQDNAFTSFDYTGYFQRVATDRLDLMMEMEADRMVNLNIAEEFVQSELEVVLEERAQRVDSEPGALYSEQARAAQFLNHPYGRPIIGWPQEVAALTRDDAEAFYQRHYAPNNAVLVVAGDVEPEEVLALAQEHYGPIPANPAVTERDRVAEPPQLAARRLEFNDPRISQPYMLRSYLAPSREAGNQRPAAALEVLANVLGGSAQTSVLSRKLDIEQGLAVSASAYYSDTALDQTTFGLSVVPAPGVSLEEAEAALDTALAEFLEEGVDPGQLERIRNQIRAAQIYASDSTQGLANRYGSALTSGLTVADVRDWPEIVQSITAEEVVEAARAVFDPRRSVTGYLRPAAEEVTQ